MTTEIQYLDTGDGERLAYCRRDATLPDAPGLVFLAGFRSDMSGSKALSLDEAAAACGTGLLRFDYFGHGLSSGAFSDGTISRWLADSLAVIDQLTCGPQILVGSSMGGWLALLAALRRPERVKSLVLIAPAPDFTETLMWPGLSESERQEILHAGFLRRASAYSDEPTIITRRLFEDGRRNLILGAPIQIACPVQILQGMQDPDVPYAHALRLVDTLAGGDVSITLVKDGDHRLSRPQDLALLNRILRPLMV